MALYVFPPLLHANELNHSTIEPKRIIEILDLSIEPPFIIAMGATWCPGCEKNTQQLNLLAQTWPVIYIHYDAEANKFPHNSLWIDYPDPNATILKQSGIIAMPTTVFVIEGYYVEKVIMGPLDHQTFAPIAEPL